MAIRIDHLVGRSEELAALRAGLADGGCVLAGSRGVGKSRLAAHAAASFATDGRRVLRVVATMSASAVPFGPFSHLADVAATSIPEVLAYLRDAGDVPTLIVDDADLLDGASAALVLAIASTRTARLLVTMRGLERPPDAITALWKEGFLERIDLQPLSRAESRQLIDELLAGQVHATVYDRLDAVCHGNPLYLSELVRGCRRTGRLAVVDERWQLVGSELEFGRITDVINSHLLSLSPEGRELIELLAIGSPMTLSQVETITSPTVIEELELAGTTTTTRDATGRVRLELAHPIFGEVVSANFGAAKGNRLRQTLAEILDQNSTGEIDQLRAATWLLESGVTGDERFVAASRTALRQGSPGLAVQLADAAPQTLLGAITLAEAQFALDRVDAVEVTLTAFEAAAATSPLDVAGRYVRVRFHALKWQVVDPHAAETFLDRCRSWRDDTDWRCLIATHRGELAVFRNEAMTARDHLRVSLDDEGGDSTFRFFARFFALYALSDLVLVDELESVDAELHVLVEGMAHPPWEAGIWPFVVERGRIAAGRPLPGITARLAAAQQAAREVGDRPVEAAMTAALGYAAMSQGHAQEAERLVLDACDKLAAGDPVSMRYWLLAELASIRAMLGRADAAVETLSIAEQAMANRPPAATHESFELARCWVDVALGRHSAALSRLLQMAAHAGQDIANEIEPLYLAVRLGAEPSRLAARLDELARQAQGPIVAMYAAQARALAERDPVALIDIATQFEVIGRDLFAAEAAAQAAVIAQDQGLRDSARRASALSQRCAQRCEGVRTPALSLNVEVVSLTAREREIATLAARGLTNAAIAEELTLSVRSVETYVLRACRKLGIASRAELATALHGPG